ncbi:dihydrofolate reductase family protein [Sorangium sp. So ce693]|uniref:dihydrofolate reductase family protein n=1 Tax=Sorangium sp. So ce693 TaxID=3133318 RepID=UPI003F62E853
MRKLTVFNQISLDGYFSDGHGDMSWAHKADEEWRAFTEENARGGGELVFGRVTYELMASFWPTRAALEAAPAVAERMNSLPKVVFSRSLDSASWNNTRLIKGDLATEVRKLKAEPGPNMVVMGSGSIVSQLTDARLVDEYQIVVNALVLGSGRTLFEGVKERADLRLKKTRSFSNGNVVLWYEATV